MRTNVIVYFLLYTSSLLLCPHNHINNMAIGVKIDLKVDVDVKEWLDKKAKKQGITAPALIRAILGDIKEREELYNERKPIK